MPKSQEIIGRGIRRLREAERLTLEKCAEKAGITYQYLSSLENGYENFSIGVLEQIAGALGCSLQHLVNVAFAQAEEVSAPTINRNHFRAGVPLPPGMTIEHLESALNQTQRIIFQINSNLRFTVGKVLRDLIQGNNFSGLVSNILCDSLSEYSPYKHNHYQKYPDLVFIDEKGKKTGLEIKSTINIGKGGESHNGHSGWHLIACYQFDPASNIFFVHVQMATLNGHRHSEPDWKYLGSNVKEETGSQRTETYITNLYGTTKLRDGSVYLDPSFVNYSRWRQSRRDEVTPQWSIFHEPLSHSRKTPLKRRR
jgi:transcriptional regulator with XRE-family HTH domain